MDIDDLPGGLSSQVQMHMLSLDVSRAVRASYPWRTTPDPCDALSGTGFPVYARARSALSSRADSSSPASPSHRADCNDTKSYSSGPHSMRNQSDLTSSSLSGRAPSTAMPSLFEPEGPMYVRGYGCRSESFTLDDDGQIQLEGTPHSVAAGPAHSDFFSNAAVVDHSTHVPPIGTGRPRTSDTNRQPYQDSEAGYAPPNAFDNLGGSTRSDCGLEDRLDAADLSQVSFDEEDETTDGCASGAELRTGGIRPTRPLSDRGTRRTSFSPPHNNNEDGEYDEDEALHEADVAFERRVNEILVPRPTAPEPSRKSRQAALRRLRTRARHNSSQGSRSPATSVSTTQSSERCMNLALAIEDGSRPSHANHSKGTPGIAMSSASSSVGDGSSREDTSSQMDQPVGGYLRKRGRRSKILVLRFFTLQGSLLRSFKNEKTCVPSWSVDLSGARVGSDGVKCRVVILLDDTRKLVLYADTPLGTRRWSEAFVRAAEANEARRARAYVGTGVGSAEAEDPKDPTNDIWDTFRSFGALNFLSAKSQTGSSGKLDESVSRGARAVSPHEIYGVFVA